MQMLRKDIDCQDNCGLLLFEYTNESEIMVYIKNEFHIQVCLTIKKADEASSTPIVKNKT